MAANRLPIPIPPRTPTPISDDDDQLPTAGLGIEGAYGSSPVVSHLTFDNSSSPTDGGLGSASTRSDLLSPTFSIAAASPNESYSPLTPQTPQCAPDASRFQSADANVDPAPKNPFNFTTVQYTAAKPSAPAARSDIGKRRGHKYKHSSISHQIFLEPAPRAPLQLPAALPMPTRKEVSKSMTPDQKGRLAWCLCHFLVAAYVQWEAHDSLAMTALSRLLFFDAAGAVACVLVDMMGNFEVWKRSSVKHPFGLERVDVLAGFGLAVFIGFMGLDVISHGIQHSLENTGSHVPHSAHKHGRVSPGSVDSAALLAIIVTVVSAVVLKNHARIGKAMRFELMAGWGRILGNPSHFLTLSCSTLLLMLPLLSINTYKWFDMALSFAVALVMVAFGARLGSRLASPLLMSYSGPGASASVRDVIAEIEGDPSVSIVQDARFWQVHYGLCMANLSLRYREAAYGVDMPRLRERISSLVRNKLGGGYGSGGLKWEVSIQLIMERD